MIAIETNAPQVAAELQAKGPRVIELLTQTLNTQAVKLQAHIVADKLSGQVLQHRSGKLAASIRVLQATPDALAAEVQGGGGPAFYGRIHEYGRIVTYLRHGAKRSTSVTAHFPERSFMRTALEDRREEITTALQQALTEAVQ